METERIVLQIVPHLPGSYGGVGDYALALAKKMAASHGLRTVFAVAKGAGVEEIEGFRVISGLEFALTTHFHHVILHYVNYGYQSRGIPFGMRDAARTLRSRLSGRWITMFHEIYASGPPWRSAFWLRPWQVKIARAMIDLSHACVVSNEVIKREIQRHDSAKKVYVVPVMSNLGEPPLSELRLKSPNRWVICGGTELIKRSLHTLRRIHKWIPREFYPATIDVVGGGATPSVRHQLRVTKGIMLDTSIQHHPEISSGNASQILAACSFGWLDYFGPGKAWPGMIFKSGSFAALYAHGIIPVLAHKEPPLSLGSDPLPGPFFCMPKAVKFPERERLGETRDALHAWYNRNASSVHAAAIFAEALR
jgi:hypothetical protein